MKSAAEEAAQTFGVKGFAEANGQLQRNRGRNMAPRDTGTPELKSLRDWYGGDGD